MAENDFMTSNRCYAHAVVKNKWGHLPGGDLTLAFDQKSVQKNNVKIQQKSLTIILMFTIHIW
jgi:hypothetical protein